MITFISYLGKSTVPKSRLLPNTTLHLVIPYLNKFFGFLCIAVVVVVFLAVFLFLKTFISLNVSRWHHHGICLQIQTMAEDFFCRFGCCSTKVLVLWNYLTPTRVTKLTEMIHNKKNMPATGKTTNKKVPGEKKTSAMIGSIPIFGWNWNVNKEKKLHKLRFFH